MAKVTKDMVIADIFIAGQGHCADFTAQDRTALPRLPVCIRRDY